MKSYLKPNYRTSKRSLQIWKGYNFEPSFHTMLNAMQKHGESPESTPLTRIVTPSDKRLAIWYETSLWELCPPFYLPYCLSEQCWVAGSRLKLQAAGWGGFPLHIATAADWLSLAEPWTPIWDEHVWCDASLVYRILAQGAQWYTRHEEHQWLIWQFTFLWYVAVAYIKYTLQLYIGCGYCSSK